MDEADRAARPRGQDPPGLRLDARALRARVQPPACRAVAIQGAARAEKVAQAPDGSGGDFFIHHSSVSHADRALAEERFMARSSTAIIATSTRAIREGSPAPTADRGGAAGARPLIQMRLSGAKQGR